MSENATNCRSCGEPLTQRFCASCGTDSQCASCGVPLTGNFCGSCGAAAAGAPAAAAAGRTAAKNRPSWLIPVAVITAIALLAAVVGVLIGKGGSSSKEAVTAASTESSTTVSPTTTVSTTTTIAPTTTLPPTTVAVSACQADPATLKSVLLTSKSFDSNTLSHMTVYASSIQTANNGRYVRFKLDALDNMSGQPVGVVVRCESGSWKYVTVVDGYSCSPSFTGEDLEAARVFGVC